MYILWTLLAAVKELKADLCIIELWFTAINSFTSSFL